MLTTHAPKAISWYWPNSETKNLAKAALCDLSYVNFWRNTIISQNSLRKPCNEGLLCSFGSTRGCIRQQNHLSKRPSELHLHVSASSDDEYRSSRNIAISLYRRYRNVVDRGGVDNLKEFISAGVNAYALGCTNEGLRMELMEMKDSGVEIEAMQTYGGNTTLKYKIFSEEVDECILWLSIIFITILCTPQPTVVRWSSTPPVSDEIKLQWNGFCALIANAYYTKGMAWLPVKTLQLEQIAVLGTAEEPSVVASRMLLVFSTLEEKKKALIGERIEEPEVAKTKGSSKRLKPIREKIINKLRRRRHNGSSQHGSHTSKK